jgi:YD repeat-containing protein
VRRLAWATLIACSAAAPAAVGNHAAPSTAAAPDACPRLFTIAGTPWQAVMFPQCPAEPFETDLPVCAGGACPRPCRATMTDGKRTGNATIRYDDHGRWLGTELDVQGEPPLEQRAATYEAGRLHTILNQDIDGQYTETLYYAGDSLVKTWDGGDGEIHVTYAHGHAVEIAHPTGTVHIGYDERGRVATVSMEDSSLAYRYTPAGVLTGIDDAKTGEHVDYTYDARGRLTRSESSTGGVPGPVAVIEYDSAGRITRIGTTTYGYCN